MLIMYREGSVYKCYDSEVTNITHKEFYGSNYRILRQTEQELLELIRLYESTEHEKEGIRTIIYSCSRIKSPESTMMKLEARGLSLTAEEALHCLYDAVGIRVICAFSEDIYRFVQWIRCQSKLCIVAEKDYCAYPKPNGYRSYHVNLEMSQGEIKGCHAEIQVRTIAMDFWATLEHQIKYKRNLPNEGLIRSELKRCADEIASSEISMQTIRDIIREGLKRSDSP